MQEGGCCMKYFGDDRRPRVELLMAAAIMEVLHTQYAISPPLP